MTTIKVKMALPCLQLGCLGYRMKDSNFCAVHTAEHASTRDPLDFPTAFKTIEREDREREVAKCQFTGCFNPVKKGYPSCSECIDKHSPAPEEPASGSFEGQLGQVLAELGELLRKKNKDYGSSYDKSVEKYGEVVALIRLGDKFNRLDNLMLSECYEVEESIEETLLDLVGYGIIELVRRRRL